MMDLQERKKALIDGLILIFWLVTGALLLHITGIGCPFRWLTGIPCAGCGMSRALVLLLTGKLRAALSMHPMVLFLPVGTALWLADRVFPERIPGSLFKGGETVLVSVFLIVYAVRIFYDDPAVRIDITGGVLWKMIKEVTYVLSELR